MSSALHRLGAFAYVRRRLVLAGSLLLIAVVLVLGVAQAGSFSDGSTIPGSPAQKTLNTMDRHFPEPDRASAQVVIQAPAGHRVDEPTYAAAIARTLADAGRAPQVATASTPDDAETSANGRTLVADVEFHATEDDGVSTPTLDALRDTGGPVRAAGLDVTFGGDAYEADAPPVGTAEGVGVLVALVVLVITFGSLLAAGMPLLIAVLGITLSIAGMLGLSSVVAIPDSALTLSLMIGLAVGIDYALFIVSRHRAQLGAGMDVGESVARATAGAGSAVVFAGVTVIIALAGLTVAQVPMLTGMGLSAAGSVAIAVLLAVGLVPALLGFAGTRLIPKPGSRAARRIAVEAGDEPRTMGASWARRVVGRPRTALAVGVVLLCALAIPAFSLQTSLMDDGNEPAGSPARQTYDTITRDFGAGANGPLVALVTQGRSSSLEAATKTAAQRLSRTPGVASVGDVEVAKDGQAARFAIVPRTGPKDPATKALVARLQARGRTLAPAVGATVAITGQTAVDIDVGAKLSAALVPFGIVVIGLSLLLLLLAFRSIAIPIKATVGFLLSVGASFGATVAVFQWGWLADLLGVSVEGPVASFMPIVVMAVLFGLAMDYEVFMVSSMRDEYVRSRDARRSIITGAGHASRVVTAAALIMVAVFGSFLTNPDADIKPIAWALAVGVLVDAFVVRMTLVPAVLALLGDRAWWVPRWLDRILPHVDLEGGEATPAAGTTPVPAGAAAVATADVPERRSPGAPA